MKKEEYLSLQVLVRIALFAAVLLTAAVPSPSLADSNVFIGMPDSGYVQSYFEEAKVGSEQAMAHGSVISSADMADIFGRYAASAGNAAETRSTAIFLTNSMVKDYFTTNYYNTNYYSHAEGSGGVAPEEGNAGETGGNRDAAGRAQPVPSRFDLGFGSISPPSVQAQSRADLWERQHAGSSTAGSSQKYKVGPLTTRDAVAQSTSLSLDRDQDLGNLTIKDFFSFKNEQEKKETQSILIWIAIGFGVVQVVILGVIVIRTLIARAQ